MRLIPVVTVEYSMEASSTTEARLEEMLWEYLDGISDLDEEAREYREEGTVRETAALDDAHERLLKKMDEDIGFQRKQCYHNAQLATSFYGGRSEVAFEYVEGYVISDRVPVPIQHAWVELDGRVAELTLPSDRQAAETWVYIGKAYEPQTVRNALDERGESRPLAGRGWQ